MKVGDYVLVTQTEDLEYYSGRTGKVVRIWEGAPYPIIVDFGGDIDSYEPFKASELEVVG